MSAEPGHDLDLSFLDDLPLTQAATEFARERHSSQHREADGASFVLHPLEVASLLERSGYPDHVSPRRSCTTYSRTPMPSARTCNRASVRT